MLRKLSVLGAVFPAASALAASSCGANDQLEPENRIGEALSCNTAPFGGAARSLPGTVQAEDFDTGGPGCAYADYDPANLGGAYRPAEQVDLQTCGDAGGGFNIGWTKGNEWLKYTVNAAGGSYDLRFRVSSTPGAPNAFHLEDELGKDLTGALSVPSTGGYQTYTTVTKAGVALSAGTHVLKLVIHAPSWNLNSFSASLSPGGSTVDLSPSKDAYVRSGAYANTNYGTSVNLTLKGNASTGSNYSRNDWITFNLSGYSNITSAKLRLYVKAVGTENTNPVPANLLFASGSASDSWSETGITWNNAPPAGMPIGLLSILTATAGTWIEYDVTSSVRAETDGAATFTITTTSSSNRGVEFASREDPMKPVLRIATSACTPTTCASQGKNCGSTSDGCGGTLSCGTCAAPQTCGGGGTPNVCGNAPSGWTLTWSDEFDGASGAAPDSSKWAYDVGWGDGGWGNGELQYYTSSRDNSYLQDGSLVIKARTDNIPSNMICGSSRCGYTSARLKTLGKFEQQYGRFEARIKIPTGRGMWPAFWTLGSNFPTVDWPACGEIDIMENWGADGTIIAGTTHDPGYDPDNGISGEYAFPNLATVANDYHVYAMEWQADAIRFYVDNTEYHCVRKSGAPTSACGSIAGTVAQPPHTWPFDHPFFMLLNLAIDGSSGNRPDSGTVFPKMMLVDYVRVYRR
jgi:beta-glucanase (GH16 family)